MNEWKPTKIGEVLKFFNGKAMTSDETGDYPIYGSNGIIGYSNKFKFANSIIIGRVGAYCGSINLEKGKYWASDNTIVADVKGENYLPFLSYLLGILPLNSLAGGSAQPLLNQTILSRLKIKIPPKKTQKKIAAVLSAYDDLIENNKRRIALLEKMAEEIYREWFVRMRFPGYKETKFEKGVPVGWEIKPINEIASEIRKGIKKKNLTSELKYLGLEHIPRKSISITDFATADSVQSDKLLFQERDILFGKIRPYLHKISIANFAGSCSSDTIVLRPKQLKYEGFLLFTIFSESFVELATISSKGTKMPRADWDFLKQLKLKIPSDALLEMFKSKFNDVFSQTSNLIKQNRILAESRNMLLSRLISGKLSVENLDIKFPPGMWQETVEKIKTEAV